MAEPIATHSAGSFAAGVREELGPPWRFALIATLFTIAMLVIPISERGVDLTFFIIYIALTGSLRAFWARARGRAFQAAVVVVCIVAVVWFVTFIWAREALGLRAGMFEVLGLNVFIPRIELILLGALTFFVVLDIVRRQRIDRAAPR